LQRVEQEYGLKLVSFWYGGLVYPLTGGFQRWSLVNLRILKFLMKVEDKLPIMIKKLCAFRVGMIFEKI